MPLVQLVDYFGFVVGEPEIPAPYPKILVWGSDFFVLNEEDVQNKIEKPRYHITSGHVIDETRGTRGAVP
jgi:hypothetical protein